MFGDLAGPSNHNRSGVQIVALLSNTAHGNIHTTSFPKGEIRGEIRQPENQQGQNQQGQNQQGQNQP